MVITMSANTSRSPHLLGIVEGFYGRAWSWQNRFDYARLMPGMGLNSYLYAPKSDPYLRKLWREHWPEDQWLALQEFSALCSSNGIIWGLGISPFELYRNYDSGERRYLKEKIYRLNELQPDYLAVLFDDMPGEQANLASCQHQIVADICEHSSAQRFLVCPTYYSYDPVLETFFGQMPQNYWQDLGHLLPAEIELLWTGNQVCSKSILVEDVKTIAEQFQRLPTLWDNYPVNDGREGCKYLNLMPLSGRPVQLGCDIQGHLCNPMNQPSLSQIPLASLAALHRGDELSGSDYLKTLCDYAGTDMGMQLAEDMAIFQGQGLDAIEKEQLAHLKEVYGQKQGAFAEEVLQWLNGEFAFDPECLTG